MVLKPPEISLSIIWIPVVFCWFVSYVVNQKNGWQDLRKCKQRHSLGINPKPNTSLKFWANGKSKILPWLKEHGVLPAVLTQFLEVTVRAQSAPPASGDWLWLSARRSLSWSYACPGQWDKVHLNLCSTPPQKKDVQFCQSSGEMTI